MSVLVGGRATCPEGQGWVEGMSAGSRMEGGPHIPPIHLRQRQERSRPRRTHCMTTHQPTHLRKTAGNPLAGVGGGYGFSADKKETTKNTEV